MSNENHHPRCATLIDSVLRCTCAQEDAWDDKMAEEEEILSWVPCDCHRGCERCGGEGYVYE